MAIKTWIAGETVNAADLNGNCAVLGDTAPTPTTLVHVVPVGSVMAWFKSITNVPTLPFGWVQCDGQLLIDADSILNGQTLPDLNGANGFLRGNATSWTTGGINGGESTHTLTEAEMPSHAHTIQLCDAPYYSGSGEIPTGDNDGIQNTGITDYTGGGLAHENKPPYFNVVWIMRIK